MIDPTAVSTIRVGELSPEPFSLTDNVPHEVGTELKRGTIEDLATFISAFIGSTDGVGFRAVSVTDGQTLPTTTQQEFILVGKGTYYNVVGGSTIICTEELNAIVSNGSYWFIGVEIPVNVELAGITQFIRDGFINTTPSEDAVYEALALKANVADSENIENKQNDLTPDGTGTKYPTVDAVNAVLPTTYSKVVYVNATSPTTATIFDTENPPVTNDNLLKNDTANLYIGTDASTWVYLTGTGYVTKIVPSISNFNTFGTSVDAGNSKTAHITRSGAMTLTGPLNILNLKISTTPTTSAGSYDILTRNSSTTALEKKLVSDFVTITGNQTKAGLLSFNNTSGVTNGVQLTNASSGSGVSSYALLLNNAGTGGSGGLIANTNGGTGLYFESYNGKAIDMRVISASGVGSGINIGSDVGNTGNLFNAGLGKVVINSAGKLSTTEIPTIGDNVTNKTYVDAKITQTITNGVTDKSPSEDAVFDALDLKVAGSGTTNYLPKFTASGTVGDSLIIDNGTNIGIGIDTPLTKLNVKSATGAVGKFEYSGTWTGSQYAINVLGYTNCNGFRINGSDGQRAMLLMGNSGQFGFATEGTQPITFTHNSTTERMRVAPSGSLLIAATTDDGIATNKLQVNGNVKASQFRISNLNTAPSSATDTGTLGEVRITATYIYVCTATNTWVRTALATW